MLNFWGGAFVAALGAAAVTFLASIVTATGYAAHTHKPHWMATSILLFVTIALLALAAVAYLTAGRIHDLEHPQ